MALGIAQSLINKKIGEIEAKRNQPSFFDQYGLPILSLGAGSAIGALGTSAGKSLASSLGGLLSGSSGAATTAATGAAPAMPSIAAVNPVAATTTSSGAGLSSLLAGPVGTAGGVLGGAAIGAGQLGGISKLAQGENPSLAQHAALFPLTGGFSLLAKPLTDAFGSGKSGSQRERDSVREGLLELGIYSKKDPDGFISLPEGEISLKELGVLPDQSFSVTDVEGGNIAPEVSRLIGFTNPLAEILVAKFGANPERAKDFAGEFANAAAASDNPEETIRSWYEKAGIDRDEAYGKILDMYEDDRLDLDTTEAYLAGIDSFFGIENPNQGQGGEEEFPLRFK